MKAALLTLFATTILENIFVAMGAMGMG
jgi:hypothetical protein